MKFLLALLAIPIAWYSYVLLRGFRLAAKRRPATDFPADPMTPQGAIRVYQSAVERRDIAAMIEAKDFLDEAEVLLRKQSRALNDRGLVDLTANTLAQAFRSQWETGTWPDLQGASSFFSEPLPLSPNVVFINHEILSANGSREVTQLRVVKRGAYWRVSHAPI